MSEFSVTFTGSRNDLEALIAYWDILDGDMTYDPSDYLMEVHFLLECLLDHDDGRENGPWKNDAFITNVLLAQDHLLLAARRELIDNEQ